MATDEIFDSAVRSTGDLAGVFEYDGETGYFYLYMTEGEQGHKILDSIHIFSGESDFGETDISVRWDMGEEMVGLFIKGALWAVFDTCQRISHGGNYKAGGKSELSSEIVKRFRTAS